MDPSDPNYQHSREILISLVGDVLNDALAAHTHEYHDPNSAGLMRFLQKVTDYIHEEIHNPATDLKREDRLIDRITERIGREWPARVTVEWSDADMVTLGLDPNVLRAAIKNTAPEYMRSNAEILLILRTPWQTHHAILWRAPARKARAKRFQPPEEPAERPVWVKP